MSDPNPQVSPREDEHAVVHVAECPTTPTNEAANTHSANGNSNGASGDVAPHVKKQPEEKARASDAPAAAEDDGEKKPSQKFVPIAITYRFDEDTFNEMIERRNMDVLKDTFGGVEGMARTFDSDLKGGIRSDTLSTRYDQFGPNVLATKEPVTFWEFLLEAFQDKIIILLCITALVSIVFGLTLPNPHSGDVERATGWIEGGAILVSVFIVTMTGAINNYRKAKKFEEMEQEQSVKDVSVMRDGKDITITSDTITVGDVLTINTGMEMVCDGLLIGGHDLKMNESAISGEPDLIDKGDDDAFIISGTTADEGNGKMLVVAIGMSSFQGQLKDTLSEEVGETPLQEHLSVLADDIGKIGLAAALLLFVSLSIKEGILIANDTRSGGSSSAVRFLNFFLVAVTLIAVAIPEGLPLAVTISLAFSMRAMMKDQCMVRVLASCETMGAATAIASDKTGTLTTNQMTVVQGCVAEKEFVLRGYELHCRTKEVPQLNRDAPEYPMNAAALEHFCRALSVNSTAVEAEVDGKLIWTGNKTEAGLLGFVKSAGHSYQDSRAKVEGSMKQFPFSSLKKRMTTVVREKNGELLGYFKGASETILETCKQYIDADGQVSDLTEDRRELFNDVILDMANQGNRTIGVAYAPLLGTDFPEEEPEVTPIFMGVLGIQDPIREAVPDAVLHANSAGLVVRMVTGDNINTAKAIGKKCNIYAENNFDIAMTGQDFRDLYRENEQELISKLPRLRVLARSSPNDKHILVGLLQRETLDVVGVTGDGTNDAPALKLADVGFAMNTGTDIAKGAADMVLLDDNFATVVTAIKWGRAVNDNVKKFLQYQLTINAAAVALTIIGALASEESKEPIAAVQLLWLNLIMDTLAALALATELPEDASLERYPVFKQAPLITRHMWIFIGVHGVFQIAVVTLLLFLGHKWFNIVEKDGSTDCDKDFGFVAANNSFNNGTIFAKHPQRIKCDEVCTDYGGTLSERRCQQGATHSTMIFNTFIWFQIFNVVNARKLYGELNAFEGVWARSKMLLQVFAVIVVLQVLCVQFFGVFMKTVGLNWWRWLICIGLGFIELILGAVVRLIPVKDFVPPEVQQKMANEAELRTHLMHHDHHMSRSTHHRPSLLVLKGKDKAIRKASMAKGRGSFTVR